MKKEKLIRNLAISGLGALVFSLVISGVYNSAVMKSTAFMSDSEVKFLKRLDEMGQESKGISAPARVVAQKSAWKQIPEKVENPKVEQVKKEILPKSNALKVARTQVVQEAKAAISKRLDLKLKEFYNAQKYKKSLTASQFSGSLFMNDGIIESLEVILPNDEVINISYAELTGNTFQYDVDGVMYSGMVYEAGNNNFMVTLTNGPFQGSRMKFHGDSNEYSPDRDVAQYDNVNDVIDVNEAIEKDRRENDPRYDEIVEAAEAELLEDEEVEPATEEARLQDESNGKMGFEFNSTDETDY
jgi:hypothetical protein